MINPEADKRTLFRFTEEQFLNDLLKRFEVDYLPTQLINIARVLVPIMNDELSVNREHAANFSHLLCVINPTILDRLDHKDRDGYFEGAELGLTQKIAGRNIKTICDQLVTACNPNEENMTTIDLSRRTIDGSDNDIQFVLNGFKNALTTEDRTDNTDEIIVRGMEMGSQRVLDHLALPEKPLLPYQRNVAIYRMKIQSTHDNNVMIGLLPTKVQGINLVLTYPNGQNTPNISLHVTNLSK